MKRIDVIIPVYNGERFIGEAVDSILNQSWKELRVLVVDDGSTDSTADKVREIQKKDDRVLLFQPGKVGIPVALNLGLSHADAPFIAFLDADDFWENAKLEKQMAAMEKDTASRICFTRIREVESFQSKAEKQQFRARPEPMNGLVRTTFLAGREIFDKYGGFDPTLESGEFIVWFSPLIHDGLKYVILPEVLAYRRIHDNNMTRNVNRHDYLRVIKMHLDAKKRYEQ